MVIYVWSNGNWIYDWEVNSFLSEHGVSALEGAREINLDKLWSYSKLTDNEIDAVNAALGE